MHGAAYSPIPSRNVHLLSPSIVNVSFSGDIVFDHEHRAPQDRRMHRDRQ